MLFRSQAGVALNPRHRSYPMLREDLAKSGIRLASIEELCALAYSITGRPQPMTYTGRPVVKVEYRDGTILDVLQSRTVE